MAAPSISHGPGLPLTAIGSAVAPAVAPAGPRAERYGELDGYRAIAVVCAVVFTVYQFCNTDHFLYFGSAGYTVLNSLDGMVPWFFVLTAFLLFEPIARSILDGGQTFSARGFATRRAVRLLPVYYTSVLVVWFSRQSALPGDWRDLVEHLTFTQVFDEQRIFYTNGPAWAISVEVFFYLGLAVLALALTAICRRLVSRRQRIAVLAGSIAAIALISLAWKGWAFWGAHRSTTASFTTWFGPLANLDNFAVGMAVALVVATLGDVRPLRPRARLGVRLSGLTVLVLAFAFRQDNSWTGVYFSTFCAAGFGCLVAAAVLGKPGDRWGRAFNWRPLLGLGGISYSVYIWHEPIMLALSGHHALVRQLPSAFVTDLIIVVAASVIVGALSFWLIERPPGQVASLLRDDGHLRSITHNGEEAVWETFRSGNPI